MRFDDWAALTAGGLVALSMFATSSVVAQAPPANWEEVAERLGALEDRNAALQERVIELEAEEGEHWLSEARATEIRGVVADVLADADARMSLQSSGVSAGWDDGFFLQSPDGRFRLNIGGMAQTRFQYSSLRETYPPTGDDSFIFGDTKGSRSGYDVPHARLDLSGNVFGPGTGFRLLGEYASQRGEIFQPWGENANYYGTHNGNVSGSFRLLDAWMSHEISPGFSVRAGQFKLPFDRGWEMPIRYQMTGERTTVAHHMGLGRSQGAELRWTSDTVRVRGALSDGANDNLMYGMYIDGTQPMNSPWWYQQTDWSVSGRLDWKIAGSWTDFDRMTSPPGEAFSVMMGFGFHAQKNKLNLGQKNSTLGDNDYNEWLATTADVTLNFGGASLTASGYYHSIKSRSAIAVQPFAAPGSGSNPTYDLGTVQIVGASLFGSVYVTNDIEMFAGWEYMAVVGNPLSTLGSVPEEHMRIYDDPQAFNAVSLGFNWFIDGEDLKFTFSGMYMPSEVSYGWTTLETGVRGTPVSDGFVIRTQLQLLF
jgi:hypothetical protein